MMKIEIKSELKGNILVTEIFGGPNDGGNADLWLSIFDLAHDAGAEGILLVNNLQASISPVSALTLNKNAYKYPSIRAIANCRTNLPDTSNMFVYTLMNRVAKTSGREFLNFFNRDEAMTWLNETLNKKREE